MPKKAIYWPKLVDLINSRSPGEEITLKEIRENVGTTPMINYYLNSLKELGFIEKAKGYNRKILKNIPGDIPFNPFWRSEIKKLKK